MFTLQKYEKNALTMFSSIKIKSVHIRKNKRNGLTMFSSKNLKVIALQKYEKNGLTMFSPIKIKSVCITKIAEKWSNNVFSNKNQKCLHYKNSRKMV